MGVFGNILRILRIYLLREWFPLTTTTSDCASFLNGVRDLSLFFFRIKFSHLNLRFHTGNTSVEKEACQKISFCIAEYTYEKYDDCIKCSATIEDMLQVCMNDVVFVIY